MLVKQLAPLSCAVYRAGALTVTVAEEPARLCLDDSALLAEWNQPKRRCTRRSSSSASFSPFRMTTKQRAALARLRGGLR
jgi:hypothetical protein